MKVPNEKRESSLPPISPLGKLCLSPVPNTEAKLTLSPQSTLDVKSENPLAGLTKPNPLAGLGAATANAPKQNPLGALGLGGAATSTAKPNPLAALGLGGAASGTTKPNPLAGLGLGGPQSSGPSNPLAALGGSSGGGSPKVNLL